MVRFSSLDMYPKTLQEFRQRTLTGAIVSITVAVLIALLTLGEVADLLRVKRQDHLFVDTTRGEQLRINLNITFPALPCSVISLDTLDLSGNHAPEKDRSITKTRLDAKGHGLPPSEPSANERRKAARDGRRLLFDNHHNHGNQGAAAAGSAAGAGASGLGSGLHGQKPDLRQFGNSNVLLSKLLAELLPTVFDDKEAVAELRQHIGEGCHLEGSLLVNKVAGNFHFSLAKADLHVLMSVYGKRDQLNVSHIIHRCGARCPHALREPPCHSHSHHLSYPAMCISPRLSKHAFVLASPYHIFACDAASPSASRTRT